jgi:hypothetical protein
MQEKTFVAVVALLVRQHAAVLTDHLGREVVVGRSLADLLETIGVGKAANRDLDSVDGQVRAVEVDFLDATGAVDGAARVALRGMLALHLGEPLLFRLLESLERRLIDVDLLALPALLAPAAEEQETH